MSIAGAVYLNEEIARRSAHGLPARLWQPLLAFLPRNGIMLLREKHVSKKGNGRPSCKEEKTPLETVSKTSPIVSKVEMTVKDQKYCT